MSQPKAGSSDVNVRTLTLCTLCIEKRGAPQHKQSSLRSRQGCAESAERKRALGKGREGQVFFDIASAAVAQASPMLSLCRAQLRNYDVVVAFSAHLKVSADESQ